jgi:hypothetical protein
MIEKLKKMSQEIKANIKNLYNGGCGFLALFIKEKFNDDVDFVYYGFINDPQDVFHVICVIKGLYFDGYEVYDQPPKKWLIKNSKLYKGLKLAKIKELIEDANPMYDQTQNQLLKEIINRY